MTKMRTRGRVGSRGKADAEADAEEVTEQTKRAEIEIHTNDVSFSLLKPGQCQVVCPPSCIISWS